MTTKRIFFRSGFKYQLTVDYSDVIPALAPPKDITTQFVDLSRKGDLTIRAGYAWDGPSGPTVDTKDFMRGSLIHDALYGLLRHRHLEPYYRDLADALLRQTCLEDGMPERRANYVHEGVQRGGGPSADPAKDRPIFHAP